MHDDITAWRSQSAFSMRMSIQFIIMSLQQVSILDAFIIVFMGFSLLVEFSD